MFVGQVFFSPSVWRDVEISFEGFDKAALRGKTKTLCNIDNKQAFVH